MAKYVVAVDGEVGAGKSTVCRMAGNMLGWPAISTGIFYRTVAFIVQRHNVALDAEQDIAQLLQRELPRMRWELTTSGIIYYDKEKLTNQLQREQLGDTASMLSVQPRVRELLLPLQREVAQACESSGVIVDGRDMGTVVFPQADVKIFMFASLEQRVMRRAGEEQTDLHQLRTLIAERDVRDRNRTLAPLKKAADAIELDTSNITAAQAAARMVSVVRERLPNTET